LAFHNNTGKEGERLARDYFREKGFTILHQNWRYARYEVDLIASREGILYFIEVKTRRSRKFGLPEESVTTKKLSNLLKAGEAYQYQYPQWKRVQYCILSVTLEPGGGGDFVLIEDVYL
jgi:putative endonuclease